MSGGKNRQTAGWVKHYRLFLCLLLLAVLTMAGVFYYSMFRDKNMMKEGTLVRRMSYERQV